MIEEELVKEILPCQRCGEDSKLILYTENNLEKIIYRCLNRKCRSKHPLKVGLKLPLDVLLFVVYLIICNGGYEFIQEMTGISQTTIAKIKAILRIFFKKENDKVLILGGLGVKKIDDLLCV
ncbi:hypothetical protein NBO_8g0020 [Nosema bombycis CQ1]|uniref:Uncharacterized protein n=1 Tax=Nosema bombycis (strain CQ1 / CVCC 102059) TaxID=578461 RepID=R0MLN1_NOSB1|nr:hypothetical protein NBO_8g0020 [Nosema bombycis CQ1]|eukprot:EOB15155.1 hypothetical protein NBO_8g0020 [Nosema bombycis CQ1]